MKAVFHKVVSVEALPEFVLGVRFAGGEEKRYDMKPVFADWPMFEGLRKSPELFGEVVVGPGGYGVVWGDEWDVGADELFANGEGAARSDERRVTSDERGRIPATKGTKKAKGRGTHAETRRDRGAEGENHQTTKLSNHQTTKREKRFRGARALLHKARS